jgi:hypothetical protein
MVWPAIHNGGYCQRHFNLVSDGMRSIDPVVEASDLRKQLLGLAEDIDAEAGTATGEDWNYAKVFVQSMLHYMDAEMVHPPEPKSD